MLVDRPVEASSGAGRARLPLQKAVSYRGLFFLYSADFRRARARPGQASLAGLAGLAGLGWQAWLG